MRSLLHVADAMSFWLTRNIDCTVEAGKLEHDCPQPQTKERRTIRIKSQKPFFQLLDSVAHTVSLQILEALVGGRTVGRSDLQTL